MTLSDKSRQKTIGVSGENLMNHGADRDIAYHPSFAKNQRGDKPNAEGWFSSETS